MWDSDECPSYDVYRWGDGEGRGEVGGEGRATV